MNFPLYVAKRYLHSKSSKNAVNIITRIAISSVVVGSLALFVVLSGFSGLRDFSLQFTNVFDSDLKALPLHGKTFYVSSSSEEKIKNIEGISAYSKVIQERVFLQYKGKNHIANIKGVDAGFGGVIPLDSILIDGEWVLPNEQEVVIGINTALKLSLGSRDYGNLLELFVPKPGTGQVNVLDPTQAFREEKVVVSGIYQVTEDLNGKYVFSDLELARSFLNLESGHISAIEFKLKKGADEELVRAQLTAILSEDIILKNRIQQNDALYKMLNTENLFVYIFVSLIAAIAIFNIAGTIIMMILEKRRNIKTLISLGLTVREVRKIFFYEGFLMTFIGLFIGLFLGVIAVMLQMQFGFIPITQNLAYPVKFEFINLIIVFLTIALLGGLASKLAATKIVD